MSEIQNLFNKSQFRSSKYKKYFSNYDEILAKFKGKDVKIIEIGVQDGGSLEIWKEYYSKLNINIPEKKLGINPGVMSISEKIEIVHIYGNPSGMQK